MRTIQRLTHAHQTAKFVSFDETSKYIILSDCHRGDGSLSDEFTKNQNTFIHALKTYYQAGFTLIEAGDGDELWEHSKYSVIKNAHIEVFDVMQKFYEDNRFYLLYGNHNIYLKNKSYIQDQLYHYYNHYTGETNAFFEGIQAYEAICLKHRITGQEILTVHGHQGDLPNDQLWFFSMLSLKYFWRFLHAFGFQNPSSPVKNEHKRHKIEKNFNKWIETTGLMLICGHTHRIKYPLKGELPYFNTGCCIYPSSMSCVEIENNKITTVRWQVSTNPEGILQIQRHVLYGPHAISDFDYRQD